jgi:peptidoglycan hydrolase-like protein with peptidoglycan-binding domain
MCEYCENPQHLEQSKLSRRHVLLAGLSLGASLLVGCNTTPPLSAITDPDSINPRLVSSPTIASTSAWLARAPSSSVVLTGARPDKIIVHHTADPNGTDYSQTRAYQLARNIQNLHMNTNGWIDSGQHFTISRGGFVMEARHRSFETLNGGTGMVQGAHCPGQNDIAIGIENEGTYTSVQPPAVLYNQLVALCAYICQQYGLSSDRIYGHRDFINTQCPGDQLYAMLPKLRSDVATKLGTGNTTTRVWTTAQKGNINERAKTVQYLLRARGYSITVDGNFGTGTESVAKSFQTSKGLPSDGIVGKTTWENLILNVQNGSSGDGVRAVQSQLASKNYGVGVDGVFGTGTTNAVKSFQTSKGLLSDGIVGPDTWAKLTA